MIKRPWLVVVGAGRWQLDGIVKAQQAGIRVFALDGNPDAEGLAIAERAHVVDIRDSAAVLHAVKTSGIRPDGAVSLTSDAGMMAVGTLRKHYDLPGADLDILHLMVNKAEQRRVWQENGLPIPEWYAAKSVTQARKAVKQLGLPVVVKPVDSAGSRGVTVVESESEIGDAIGKAFNASSTRTIIIEAVLGGREYTVETLTIEKIHYVLAVTVKQKVPGTRGTVACELATPDSSLIIDRVGTIACRALEALGYPQGPGHTEIMLDEKDNIGIIETSGRGGGFMVADGLVPACSGYDLNKATVMMAVGERVHKPDVESKKKACVLRFIPSQPGRVRRIFGFDEVVQLKNVDAGLFIEEGFIGKTVSQDEDRFGYILSWGDDVGDALSLADRAESLVGFEIDTCL